tara:strand:+ start:14177 stop:15073 length:897 start_codon:yes stop_codon:yes gene_type:complete
MSCAIQIEMADFGKAMRDFARASLIINDYERGAKAAVAPRITEARAMKQTILTHLQTCGASVAAGDDFAIKLHITVSARKVSPEHIRQVVRSLNEDLFASSDMSDAGAAEIIAQRLHTVRLKQTPCVKPVKNITPTLMAGGVRSASPELCALWRGFVDCEKEVSAQRAVHRAQLAKMRADLRRAEATALVAMEASGKDAQRMKIGERGTFYVRIKPQMAARARPPTLEEINSCAKKACNTFADCGGIIRAVCLTPDRVAEALVTAFSALSTERKLLASVQPRRLALDAATTRPAQGRR